MPASDTPSFLAHFLAPPIPSPPLSQTNVSVCSSLGHPFVSQFNLIFLDMLAVYK